MPQPWRPFIPLKIALEITPNLEPLFGTRDENLRLMEDVLGVRIDLRSDAVHVNGPEESVGRVKRIFADFEALRKAGVHPHNGELNSMLKLVVADPAATLKGLADAAKQRAVPGPGGVKRGVQPRSLNQSRYVEAIEKNVIEVAPLAFMRGRTLNDAFIIMDEAQNTTIEQMKMFLTRLGNNSKAVITGDITQIDLPNPKKSGLVDAINLLGGVEGIHFCHFEDVDVVRHSLVQRIIRAYESKPAQQELPLGLGEAGESRSGPRPAVVVAKPQ